VSRDQTAATCRGVCAWAGIVGAAVFAVAAIAQPLYRRDRTFDDPYSSYAIGELGWVQTVAFVALGAGSLALATGLSPPPRAAAGWLPGRVLLGIWGGGVLLAAGFPLADGPVPASGQIHSAASLVAFLAITAASLTLSHAFTNTHRWAPFGRRSTWVARCLLAALLLATATQQSGWFGVTQRIFLAAVLVWLTTVANHLRRLRDTPPVAAG
jgi:Protein of unknown function (DUF998)